MEPDISSLASRIRIAVKRGGGNKAVAAASGVPLGSINNYIAGVKRMPFFAAIALAKACGVSLDWLATGKEALGQPDAVAPVMSFVGDRLTPEQQRWLIVAVHQLAIGSDDADVEIGPFVRGFFHAALRG